MAKKRNIIVGQSGGPTAVINSSLAGVYKNAIERGFDKVYGMLHGIQGLLDEQYIDLSTQIHSELDIELLKRTPSAFLGSCRYKLPEIHEDKAIYEKIFEILNKLDDNYSSTGRGIQSAHHVKKGGLATAGSSNNSHKLSILHRNINSIKGTSNIRLCTVILFQVNRL